MKIDKISFAKEHSFKILNKLHLLRKENSMCDATLSVEGKKFPVHRNVLCASSAYFQ